MTIIKLWYLKNLINNNLKKNISYSKNLYYFRSHEVIRVFADRLVDSSDRKLFFDLIKVSNYVNDSKESLSSDELF